MSTYASQIIKSFSTWSPRMIPRHANTISGRSVTRYICPIHGTHTRFFSACLASIRDSHFTRFTICSRTFEFPTSVYILGRRTRSFPHCLNLGLFCVLMVSHVDTSLCAKASFFVSFLGSLSFPCWVFKCEVACCN